MSLRGTHMRVLFGKRGERGRYGERQRVRLLGVLRDRSAAGPMPALCALLRRHRGRSRSCRRWRTMCARASRQRTSCSRRCISFCCAARTSASPVLSQPEWRSACRGRRPFSAVRRFLRAPSGRIAAAHQVPRDQHERGRAFRRAERGVSRAGQGSGRAAASDRDRSERGTESDLGSLSRALLARRGGILHRRSRFAV